jgi:DNA polymerase-3 subunit delta
VKIQANQLPTRLRKNLAPCYLVSGDEPLLVTEALDDIRQAARERGFMARESQMATQSFDWSALAASSANLSLFAEKRVIELRIPTGKPGRDGSKAIVDLVDRLGPELMLIVITPKLDRNAQKSKWVKTLESRGAWLPIYTVGNRELPRWVAERMRAEGLQPDRAAAQLIAERVEGNLLAARQEIVKLRLLLGEGPVTAEDVANAVADSSRYDVFKLVEAALVGDARRALRILGGLQAEGIEPVIVFWALGRELNMAVRLSEAVRRREDIGALMRQHQVWDKRQDQLRSCLGRVTGEELHRLLKAARRGDAASKGQLQADPWQMATSLVLALSLGGRKVA